VTVPSTSAARGHLQGREGPWCVNPRGPRAFSQSQPIWSRRGSSPQTSQRKGWAMADRDEGRIPDLTYVDRPDQSNLQPVPRRACAETITTDIQEPGDMAGRIPVPAASTPANYEDRLQDLTGDGSFDEYSRSDISYNKLQAQIASSIRYRGY